eukprot:3483284-Prymnesium_polylepis.1
MSLEAKVSRHRHGSHRAPPARKKEGPFRRQKNGVEKLLYDAAARPGRSRLAPCSRQTREN